MPVRPAVSCLSEFFAVCPFPLLLSARLSICALRLPGTNCSSIEGKWGHLVAYMVLRDPDFDYLQELWVDLDPARVVGLPYRIFSCDTFRGGGVAMLVHLRRAGQGKGQVWRERHALGVCVRPKSLEAVAVVSTHFPLKMDPDNRTRVCKDTIAF